MEETKFLSRDEKFNEVFAMGKRDVSQESYWGFHLNFSVI